MKKGLKLVILAIAIVGMVLFALTAIAVGGPTLAKAAGLSTKTLLYYTISFVAGLTLLVCSTLSLRPAWRPTMAVAGLIAALALPVNQFLGLHFQAILCFTPT